MGQFYNAPWNVANLASGKIGAHNLVQNNGKRNFSQNLSDNDTKKKASRFLPYFWLDEITKTLQLISWNALLKFIFRTNHVRYTARRQVLD